MKAKTALYLILFLLLLLLPLVALGAKTPEHPAPTASSAVQSSAEPPQGNEKPPQGNEKPPQAQASPAPTAAKSEFKILDESSGQVLTVSDKEFLYGAVATEMSPTSPIEALKAQAVSAYTYYSRLRAQQRQHPDASLKGADFAANIPGWHLYTTKEQMQKRWGESFNTYYPVLDKVATAVYGQTLQSNGELICATYYAISSGNTEAAKDIWGGDYSYLVPVASPGDAKASGYSSTVSLTAQQVQQAAQRQWGLSLSGEPSGWFGKAERTGSGSVTTQVLGGKTVKGGEVRTAFGLRSANYTVAFKDGKFTFSVKGYGHGVGLSQAGAEYMAGNGADYKKILAWYYPGTTLAAA